MWLLKKNVRCYIIGVCILLCMSDGVLAQQPADVRLLLDVSGSMKQNDPSNLRQSSIALLMQLLPEGSKAGVWAFSTDTTPLMPHGVVDAAWKKRATRAASNIDSKGLFTNIGGALEEASFEGSDQYNKSIILLTDGMVDIDKDPDLNKEEWQRISSDVLNDVKAKGFVIHTVSLSDNADKELMEALSLNTDGLAQVAKNADQLLKAFLKTFDAAVPTDQVPLSGNEFAVDSSVEEFTALIFKKASQESATLLISPDSKTYSARKKASFINWYEGDSYDLVTVKRPLEGTWMVNADMDDDSRITIVSNLNLGVEGLPNNVYLGHEQIVTSTLNEDGKPITRSAFLKLMRVKATLKAGNSLNNLKEVWAEDWPTNRAPRAGKFTFTLPKMDQIGFYEVTLLLDGRTFQRSFTHRLTVRQAYSTEIEQTSKENQAHTLTVLSQTPTINTQKTHITLLITDPEGTQTPQDMVMLKEGDWQATVLPTQKGQYLIDINIDEVNKSGNTQTIELEPLTFTSSIEVVEEVVAPESTEELQPKSGTPAWLIYTLIGIGNIILFGGLFFIIKKLFGKKSSDDSDDELALETTPESDSSEVPTKNEKEPANPIEKLNEEDDDDGEPPMEDLNSVDDLDEEPPMEGLTSDEPDNNDIELSEDIDGDASAENSIDNTLRDTDTNPEIDDDDVDADDIDPDEVDIDAIMAQQESAEQDSKEAPEVKSQEEDIDDAINDLLNELEGDDDIK